MTILDSKVANDKLPKETESTPKVINTFYGSVKKKEHEEQDSEIQIKILTDMESNFDLFNLFMESSHARITFKDNDTHIFILDTVYVMKQESNQASTESEEETSDGEKTTSNEIPTSDSTESKNPSIRMTPQVNNDSLPTFPSLESPTRSNSKSVIVTAEQKKRKLRLKKKTIEGRSLSYDRPQCVDRHFFSGNVKFNNSIARIFFVEINVEGKSSEIEALQKHYKGETIKPINLEIHTKKIIFRFRMSGKMFRQHDVSIVIPNGEGEELIYFNETVGLNNPGTFCFGNAVFQCLSQIEELVNPFIDESYKTDIIGNQPIATCFQKMLCSMSYGTGNPKTVTHGFNELEEIGIYRTGEHDVQEFFTFFKRKLKEECSNETQKTLSELFEYKLFCQECNNSSVLDMHATLQTEQSSTCTDFIPIFQRIIEKNETCKNCGKKMVITGGKILVIPIMRSGFQDNSTTVCDRSITYPKMQMFKLFGIIEYIPSNRASNGHYVAKVKNYKNEKWYHCNDGSIKEIEKEFITNPQKDVMLFYSSILGP